MNITGIIRRVDDLGRVVLPRSLRKSLKIDVGTKLDIRINENKEIVLKKISELSENEKYQKYVIVLQNIIENDILIVDRDKVLASTKKNCLNNDISEEVYNIFQSRDCVIKKQEEGAQMLPIFEGEKIDNYNCQLFVPIIKDGDTIGGIIVFTLGNNCFSEDNIKVCKSFALLMSMID